MTSSIIHDVKLTNGVLFLENNYFPEASGESVSHHKLRYSNYKECWKSIKNEIEVVLNFCLVI